MTTSDRVPAEDIVEALAKTSPLANDLGGCVLCLADLIPHGVVEDAADLHYADCPWRLAREWVDFS